MDWDDLQFLLSVARTGSLTKTGTDLRVSPSTVGRRVASLEKSLGTLLFARQQTGYVLTDQGREVVRRAEAIENGILALERGSANLDSRVSGSVRLATTENLSTYIIIPALDSFARQYPSIRLEVVTGVKTVGLARHEADLALRLVRPERGNLTLRKLGTMSYAVYASRDYIQRCPAPKETPYSGRAFVIWDDAHAYLPVARWLLRMCPGAPVALVTSSLAGQAAAARAGLGLAVLPCFMAEATGGLIQVVWPRQVLTEDLWLVTHAELGASARVRAVASFIVDTIAKQRVALSGTRRRSGAGK
jgi:DNA-binding transcriptional LysR family regulator